MEKKCATFIKCNDGTYCGICALVCSFKGRGLVRRHQELGRMLLEKANVGAIKSANQKYQAVFVELAATKVQFQIITSDTWKSWGQAPSGNNSSSLRGGHFDPESGYDNFRFYFIDRCSVESCSVGWSACEQSASCGGQQLSCECRHFVFVPFKKRLEMNERL